MTGFLQKTKSLRLTALTVIILQLAIILLSACSAASSTQANGGAVKLQLEDCQLSAPGLALRLPARCGHLQVYEDRQAASGRQISLKIAVIPAISRSPAPDPLFFLTGGPGQAATESYLQISEAFSQVNQKRDIILVDQRGTGGSNRLDCNLPDMEEQGAAEAQADTTTQLQACLDKLDANPALYTTAIAMQDLDQVRETLGYQTINLYGVSYGTRAALSYLRQFPDRVRTITLDGIVPPQEALGLNVARDAQRALDLLLQRCQEEDACAQAFPDAAGDFNRLFSRLEAQTIPVSLPDPVSGEPSSIDFTKDELSIAIRLLSYAPETVALLPLLAHTAVAQDDLSPMAAQYRIAAGQIIDSIAQGMGFSVLCAEDVPFIDPQAASQANSGTYMGSLQTDQLFEVCKTWPVGEIPADFKAPIQSDVPALLLSGEADPVTPPENGALVAQGLPNSLQLVAPGQGHNVIYRGCLPLIFADFIEAGTIAGLDAACVQDIKPMPFFVNFSGPQP